MARTYWEGRDPIGGRVRMGARDTGPWVTVVGVVADVRHNGVTAPIKEKFHRPHAQFYRSTGFTPSSMSLVVKATGDPTRSPPSASPGFWGTCSTTCVPTIP